ncbi:myotubularin-related protein 14-like isoform X3 [Bolinopsis microptera]|uniref:myotubularin-related protein 14-like isoform X3 n=1 Tax=Bolinopsis microptera TaxID=2820187 RepID=UPI003079FAEB
MEGSDEELNIPWLVDQYSQIQYHTTLVDPMIDRVEAQCKRLFLKDYNVEMLSNQAGELCGHYPRHLIIPTTYKECAPVEMAQEVSGLIHKARLARCRSRFPAPVMVYRDKFVCRSATLATTAEILGRSGMEWLQGTWDEYSSEWETCDKLREADKDLLNYLKVKHIFDMMVENKKVKFGLSITSSEKADKEKRYCDFDLYSVPYPGTEFFTEFRTKQMCAENMHFDWDQAFVNAELKLPNSPIVNDISLDWLDYKKWNLIELTSSYMMLLVKCLGEGEGGLLLHCISGWDRTPLFTSLLRLSLWADGATHQNLDAKEILYLTIAYDWMLFGHQLEDRLSKQEDVFLFCFYFLQYLKEDKFSIRQYQDSTTQFRAEEAVPGGGGESNTNMMRFNSVDSFTDTVCSNITSYTNTSTVNGSENNGTTKGRSSSPATLMLETDKCQNGAHCVRSRQSTGSVSSNGVNGNCGSCGNSVPIATNGEASSNGSSYDNTFLPHETQHAPEQGEGTDSGQNYRGSNSSIDSWLMVSGSLQKENHLDKIMESKRLQKLDSVYQYFGEAFAYLVSKGTITPTCTSSWSTVIGQLADSVSKVTFGLKTNYPPDESCRNTFEMVAMNSFNSSGRSVT